VELLFYPDGNFDFNVYSEYFVQSRKNYVRFCQCYNIIIVTQKEYEECLLKAKDAGFAISQIHKSISDFNLYF
jgi:hypothetical protein